MMKICIAGWYFRPTFFESVAMSGYAAFVVKHRPGDTWILHSELHENRGLEFGAYRQYVEKHWDGTSDVFFCHDDTEVASPRVFEEIASLGDMGVDHAYIFHDGNEEYINGAAHGRGMWMRASLIQKMASDFPADMDNDGTNVGVIAQKGILEFHHRVTKLSKNAGVVAIVPEIRFGHRGRLYTKMFVYRPTGQVPGGLVNVS